MKECMYCNTPTYNFIFNAAHEQHDEARCPVPYIRRLEADLVELREELESVKGTRDAARTHTDAALEAERKARAELRVAKEKIVSLEAALGVATIPRNR